MNQPPPQPPSLVARLLPGLALLRGYRRHWLLNDSLAGLTGCLAMLPSVIAYAGLMGLPPQFGFYAALVPLLVYPLFSTSRQVIVGPDIAISLLVASAITPLAQGNMGRAAGLAATLAVLTGLILLLGARAKIGGVADFLSKPVLVGYMTGAALILMGSQLDKLLGIQLVHNDFFQRLAEIGSKLNQANMPTLLLGAGLVALCMVLHRFAPRLPAALIVVVVAIGLTSVLDLPKRGVALVGAIPRGLPGFSLPRVEWHDAQALLPAAISIALLTYAEGILLARAFAAKNRYEVNANQELTALGLANVCNGFFRGFPVTGSQSRTTISEAAGGKTQVVSFMSAATLIVFLLFLTPVLARLPTVALASILIYGGLRLVEFDIMKRIYRYYPGSAMLAALTTLCVLAVGVVPGILVGVSLSLLGMINRLSHPPDAILSEVPGHGYHDLGPSQSAQTVPGLIAYRFYAPLLFFNAGHFVSRVRQIIAACPTHARWLCIDAQAITDVDVTVAEALQGLTHDLKKQGVALKFAHANPPLRQILARSDIAREIPPESFFSSVHECVEAFKRVAGTVGGRRKAQ